MTNFSLVPDSSPEIILGTLHRKIPEFFSSETYLGLKELGRDLETYPGLVCGAFTRFLCVKFESGQEVEICFDVIEEWAATRDSNVENYLITEVFENVRLPKLGEDAFKNHLGPQSRELYEEWMEYPPQDRLSE